MNLLIWDRIPRSFVFEWTKGFYFIHTNIQPIFGSENEGGSLTENAKESFENLCGAWAARVSRDFMTGK